MNDQEIWRRDTLGARAAEALNKNGFAAVYFADAAQALAHVLELVEPGVTVGVGGSKTLAELGVLDALAGRGQTVFNHNAEGLSPEVRLDYRRRQLSCDVFLTSANAVTVKGEIVNRDGVGNRVAAMIFGPKKVVVVAGANKIVSDAEEAETRIKIFAAPMNNKRFETPNPCVQLGECVDCKTDSRICNITTILHRRPKMTPMHVVLVRDDLGF